MISAFGVEHSLISKGNKAGGLQHHVGQNSMQHRGGTGYYNPSPDQVAASQARRADQATAKGIYQAGKPDRRVGGGRKVPLKVVMNEVGELKGLKRVVATGTLAGGTLLAGTYGANRYARSKSVAKADNRDRARTAASGVAGGAGGYLLTGAGMNMGGQLAKGKLKQRRAKRGTSPNEDRIWRQHQKAYPGGINNTARHLNYPKTLPDWRAQRLLAVKNKASVGRAALVLGTGAGGAYGVRQAQKK